MRTDQEGSDKSDKGAQVRESDQHHRLLFEGMAEGFAVHEIIFDEAGAACDYRFLEVNRAFEKLIGLPAADIVGMTVLEIWPDTETLWIERYGAVANTGAPAKFEDHFATTDRYYEVRVYLPEPGRLAAIYSDITDRRRFEKELMASEERLRQSQLLLESSLESQRGMLLFSIDREYRYLYFNQAHTEAMRAAYGTTPALGACILDLITAEEDLVSARSNYDRALAGESHSNVREYGDIQKSYYESYFSPIIDEDGTVIGATGTARDISERHAAEQALKESEGRHRTILDAATDGFWLVDAEGRLVEVNEAYSRMSGYSIEELLSMRVSDLEAVETPDEVEAHIKGVATAGGAHFESQHRRKDGTLVDVEVSSRQSAAGSPLQAVFIKDITESKRTAEELRRTNAILQAAMDQSAAGIAIADAPDGRLRYVNDAGLMIRGEDRDTVVNGVGIDEYVASWQLLDLDGRVLEAEEVPLARALMFGETNSREFIIRRAEDDDRVVHANAAPIRDQDDDVIAAIVVFHDITDSKGAEERLRMSEEKFRYLFDSSIVAKSLTRPNGEIEVNKAFCEMLGHGRGACRRLHVAAVDTPR